MHLSSLPQISPGLRAASLSLPGTERWCQLMGEFFSLSKPSFLMLGATAVWHPMWWAAQSCSTACGSMVSCSGLKGSVPRVVAHPFVPSLIHPSFPSSIHHPSFIHSSILPVFHPSSIHPSIIHASMLPFIYLSFLPPIIYPSIHSTIHSSI